MAFASRKKIKINKIVKWVPCLKIVFLMLLIKKIGRRMPLTPTESAKGAIPFPPLTLTTLTIKYIYILAHLRQSSISRRLVSIN